MLFRLTKVVPKLGTHGCYPGEPGRSRARARHVSLFCVVVALFVVSMALKASRSSRSVEKTTHPPEQFLLHPPDRADRADSDTLSHASKIDF